MAAFFIGVVVSVSKFALPKYIAVGLVFFALATYFYYRPEPR
jgi:hypothetical protein